MNNTLEKLKAVRRVSDAMMKAAWEIMGRPELIHDERCKGQPNQLAGVDMDKLAEVAIDTLVAEQEKGDSHCRDCCCARSWNALGITEYTGKSIAEHIAELRALAEPTTPQQQPASVLVEALEALKDKDDDCEGLADTWNYAIDKAIAIVRQHTREPDVEAGARTLFNALLPTFDYDEVAQSDRYTRQVVVLSERRLMDAVQACLAAAYQ